MFSKNLKYYRLKNNMTRAELAEKAGLSAMAVTYYEKNERKPSFEILCALAEALDVFEEELTSCEGDNLEFCHNQFSKRRLGKKDCEFVTESVEEYFKRFFCITDILGTGVLPHNLAMGEILLHEDTEVNAYNLRMFLGLPKNGNIGNITTLFEDKGILICFLDIDVKGFYGINGTVNGRPYIAIKSGLSNEEKRITLVHEFTHMALWWPKSVSEKEQEKLSDQIAAAFLFPRDDLFREIGISRTVLANDMLEACMKYGLPFEAFVRRIHECKIIGTGLMRKILADYELLSKKIICRYEETPKLFKNLVIRAASENEISITKAVELLKISIADVRTACYSMVG